MTTSYTSVVRAQAENLRNSAQTVRQSLDQLDLASWTQGRVAVVGMGASHHAAHALVAHLRTHGRSAYAIGASELMTTTPSDLAERYLVVSESGQSRETLVALEHLQGQPVLALTNDANSPVARQAPAHVTLGCMPDSPVYTVGYTSTLQAFGLIAERLGAPSGPPEWDALPGWFDTALADALPTATAFAASLDDTTSFDVIGAGASYAAACESALLLREGARQPATAIETYEYLHGPMEPVTDGFACIIFGARREVELAAYAASIRARVLLVTTSTAALPDDVTVVRLPVANPLQQAVLEMPAIQLLVGELARRRGLAIDGFRYHQDDTKLTTLRARTA